MAINKWIYTFFKDYHTYQYSVPHLKILYKNCLLLPVHVIHNLTQSYNIIDLSKHVYQSINQSILPFFPRLATLSCDEYLKDGTSSNWEKLELENSSNWKKIFLLIAQADNNWSEWFVLQKVIFFGECTGMWCACNFSNPSCTVLNS